MLIIPCIVNQLNLLKFSVSFYSLFLSIVIIIIIIIIIIIETF
jgi:hypothetical protein